MVAGGAGFIGSHLSPRPARAGARGRLRRRPLDREHSTTSPTSLETRAIEFISADVAHAPAAPGRRHRPPGVAGEPGRLRPHADPHAAGQLAGHVPAPRRRHEVGARLLFVVRPPRCTATRSSIRSRRRTGATSTRSARDPATTRRSASARRSLFAARRETGVAGERRAALQHLWTRPCAATTGASSPRWSPPPWPAGRWSSTATACRRAASATCRTSSPG